MFDLVGVKTGVIEKASQQPAPAGGWNMLAVKTGVIFAASGGGGVSNPDWKSGGLVIKNYSKEVKPGDAIFFDVTGSVEDVNAGVFSKWQLAVAAAVVDSNGLPDPTLRTFYPIKSSEYLFSKELNIREPFKSDVHLWFTPMPEHSVDVWIKLFANHSDALPFTWPIWATPANGWDLLDTKKFKIYAPGEAQKKLMWIGLGVAGVAGVVVVSQVFKQK